MIRVARKVGNNIPKMEGYEQVVVLMKSSKYYSLSPYSLKDENGHIMENIWQFSKVYENVPNSKQYYSMYDNTVVWEHPAETHVIDDELTPEYFQWREKGFNNEYAVRYPVGFYHRKNCLYSLTEDGRKLGYIDARKEIYLPIYTKLVKDKPQFLELKQKLRNGKNLLIIEVDGPHFESLDYYKEKYGVADDFIVNNTILVNKENMDIMLNDSKHNFGHGYCLGMALTQN